MGSTIELHNAVTYLYSISHWMTAWVLSVNRRHTLSELESTGILLKIFSMGLSDAYPNDYDSNFRDPGDLRHHQEQVNSTDDGTQVFILHKSHPQTKAVNRILAILIENGINDAIPFARKCIDLQMDYAEIIRLLIAQNTNYNWFSKDSDQVEASLGGIGLTET